MSRFFFSPQRRREKILIYLCALCVSAVLLALPTFVHAAEPLTLAEYRQVIEQTLTLVDQAIASSSSTERQTLARQAADKLETAREVRWPSGELVAIHNDTLLKLLRDPAPSVQNLRDLRARLQALRAALNDPTAKTLSAAELEKLRDIFNKPPFKQERNWLSDLIEEFLARLFGSAVTGIYDMRGFIMVLGGIMVALVILFFVRHLSRNAAAESALPIAVTEDEAHLTSAQALSNAQRLAGAGDYRSAVRQLYLSTLLLLDERGRLRYDRSLTNREYLRAVANTPTIANALRPIVETFDRIWYGFAPMSEREFMAYQERVEAIREL